jgi:signal transduction histidine kinase
VTVEDDGTGFDQASTDGGFGLTGMRERATLAAGELTVTSELGTGTRVEASFPVARVGDAPSPSILPSVRAAE